MTATEPQKANEVLSESEMIMFDVLNSDGPVLRRDEFERLCLEAGMNRHSFWIFLSYCPIITRYAPSVYGLRGADVPAGLVERLIPKRTGKSTVLIDYGWTKDRKLRVLYRLSTGILSNGIVSVPAALKGFIQGKLLLITADNSATGTLVAKEHTAWGLGPFFRRRGGEPGDYLLIVFDLTQRVAVAQIGDADVAEQSQTANEVSAKGIDKMQQSQS